MIKVDNADVFYKDKTLFLRLFNEKKNECIWFKMKEYFLCGPKFNLVTNQLEKCKLEFDYISNKTREE